MKVADTGISQPAPLTPDRVITAAAALIEEVGLKDFSMRKLAGKLGCAAMSIYHHFPSQAHLMDALVDRAVAETAAPPADLPFIDRLAFVAREFRRVGLRHPRFFQFQAVHRMNTPLALQYLDGILAVLREAGFDDRTAAHLFRMLGYYVTGATLDETNGYAAGPTAAEPVSPEDFRANYPNIASAGPYFSRENWETIFERGLGILLADFEAQRRALPGNQPAPS